MFRSLVEKNLEAARQSEKKDSPKTAIFVFVVAALLGLNAFGLFVMGRGIMLRGIGPEISGILSAFVALVGFFFGFKLLADAARNRHEDVTAQRVEQFMGAVRSLGPENEVLPSWTG